MDTGFYGHIRGRRGIVLSCAQGGGGDEEKSRSIAGKTPPAMVHLALFVLVPVVVVGL